VIIKSGEIGMLEYYIKQSMNQNLSEAERDNYAKMADKMSDKEKAKAIRDRIKDGCQ
jgi:aminoglycoside/choline kinase family phosphotransferase